MSSEEEKQLLKKLHSLGCAYHIDSPSIVADPEKTIIEVLPYYWKANDLFFMLYSLIKHRIHRLIHVQRLVEIARNDKLPDNELALLIGLCSKLAHLGDRRFNLAVTKLKRRGLKMHTPPRGETDKYLVKKWGIEQSLEAFGVKVRSFYEEDIKKFFPINVIYKNNPWLKIRALFGQNYRADIVYLKSHHLANTAYQAAKVAGCKNDPAYKIWRSLEGIEKVYLKLG